MRLQAPNEGVVSVSGLKLFGHPLRSCLGGQKKSIEIKITLFMPRVKEGMEARGNWMWL